jgi:hypothetical protein
MIHHLMNGLQCEDYPEDYPDHDDEDSTPLPWEQEELWQQAISPFSSARTIHFTSDSPLTWRNDKLFPYDHHRLLHLTSPVCPTVDQLRVGSGYERHPFFPQTRLTYHRRNRNQWEVIKDEVLRTRGGSRGWVEAPVMPIVRRVCGFVDISCE